MYMENNELDLAKQLENLERIGQAKSIFLEQIKGINVFDAENLPVALTNLFNAINACFDFAELQQFLRPKKHEIKDAMCLYIVDMPDESKVIVHCYIEAQMTHAYRGDGEWEYKLNFVLADNKQDVFFSKEIILDKLYISTPDQRLGK